MAKTPKIYFDCGPWIDAVQSEVGDSPEHGLTEAKAIKMLLEAHRDGSVQIITSMMSIAQVIRNKGRQPSLKPQYDPTTEVKAAINSLLSSGSFCDLWQFTHGVAVKARDLQWSAGFKIKPEDAIHLATAIISECTELVTFDGSDFLNRKEQLRQMGITVQIILPSDSIALQPPAEPENIIPMFPSSKGEAEDEEE